MMWRNPVKCDGLRCHVISATFFRARQDGQITIVCDCWVRLLKRRIYTFMINTKLRNLYIYSSVARRIQMLQVKHKLKRKHVESLKWFSTEALERPLESFRCYVYSETKRLLPDGSRPSTAAAAASAVTGGWWRLLWRMMLTADPSGERRTSATTEDLSALKQVIACQT